MRGGDLWENHPKRCNRFQPRLYINSINFSKVQHLWQIYYKKTEKPKKKLRVSQQAVPSLMKKLKKFQNVRVQHWRPQFSFSEFGANPSDCSLSTPVQNLQALQTRVSNQNQALVSW